MYQPDKLTVNEVSVKARIEQPKPRHIYDTYICQLPIQKLWHQEL